MNSHQIQLLAATSLETTACPTQLAVKTYVDGQTGAGVSRAAPTIGVAQLASSGTTATVTSFVPNNVFAGDEIEIEGANEANYNGRFVVTSIDPGNKQFTYTMSASASSPATGAITCERYQRVATELPLKVIYRQNQSGIILQPYSKRLM